MTKALVLAGLVFFSTMGFADHRAFFGGRTNVSRGGFGNVVFPGTGGPPFAHTGGSFAAFGHPNFANRLGASIGGFTSFHGGFRPGFGHHTPFVGSFGNKHGFGPVAYPVAFPVFIGGYGGYEGYYPQQPSVIVIQQPPPPQSPSTVIHQTFGSEPVRPVMRDYRPERNYPAEEDQARREESFLPGPSASVGPAPSEYYLIALKDHSIYSAVGYWQDGETVHYITGNNVHNQTSLDLIDIELTERLNRDRKVPVRLAPGRRR